MPNNKMLVFDDAKFYYRNFSGRPTQFIREGGERGFGIFIDDPVYAQQLAEEGWNVRITKPKNSDYEPRHYLPVKVGYKFRPPVVRMVRGRKIINMTEDMIGEIDYADVTHLKVAINPRHRTDDTGEHKITAYLREMWVTIAEEVFASDYADYEWPVDEDELPFN